MIETVGRFLRIGASYIAYAFVLAWWALRRTFRYFKRHKKTRRTAEGVIFLLLMLAALYSFVLGAPAGFPEGLVSVKKGSTLEAVASSLKARGLINSATLFEVAARLYRNDGVVVAGEYAFTQPQNMVTIAKRITHGDFELEPVRVRVEEGMSAQQIANLLVKSIPDFDKDAFYVLASKEEGRLFPDTYFILPGEDPELVVSVMTDNFNAHIHDVSVAAAIATFGRPLSEVLTMASILEKEAATTQDRRIISGILWHRIDIGMKLQVDVALDTYKTVGLPAAPIGNPSLDAIMAAASPVTTSYIYYLSDKDGITHYSTTYEQHLAKKAKYLDN